MAGWKMFLLLSLMSRAEPQPSARIHLVAAHSDPAQLVTRWWHSPTTSHAALQYRDSKPRGSRSHIQQQRSSDTTPKRRVRPTGPCQLPPHACRSAHVVPPRVTQQLKSPTAHALRALQASSPATANLARPRMRDRHAQRARGSQISVNKAATRALRAQVHRGARDPSNAVEGGVSQRGAAFKLWHQSCPSV